MGIEYLTKPFNYLSEIIALSDKIRLFKFFHFFLDK